jgi:predicted Zn-dependent peptidase/outer membrane protein OmpA-like peptidoglycan-associated protein
VLLLALVVSALSTCAQFHRLPNGIQAYYRQDTTRRLLHLGLTVRGGAALNPSGKAGIANYFEHHFWGLDDSTGATRGAALAGDGMVATSATYLEHQTFTLSLAPDSMASGFNAVAYALRTALTRPAQQARILAEVATQLQASEEAPFYFLDEGLAERLWAEPASRNPAGAYAPLLAIDSAALQDRFAHYLHPGNCFLTGTGPASADGFFRTADSLLATWQPHSSGAGLPRLPAARLTRNDYFILENEFAERPLLALAWPLPDIDADPKLHDVAEFFTALARLRGGPFHAALTATGRADALWWEYLPTRNPGCLVLRVAPHPDSVAACLQAIQDQLHAMAQPEWNASTLRQTVDRMQMLERAIAADRSTTRLDQIGRLWIRQGGFTDDNVLPLPLSLPTTDTLKRFIATYLDGRPHVAGLLANSTTSRALASSFRPVGPSIAAAPPTAVLPHDSGIGTPPIAVEVEDSAALAAAALQRDMAYLHDIRIYFYGNTMDIDSGTITLLSDVAYLLRRHPTLKLYINGYADGVGDGYVNYKLSIQRARAVQAHLVSKYKVPEGRLILQPFGEAFAEYPDDTPDHRRKNRRVTFDQAPANAEPRYFID